MKSITCPCTGINLTRFIPMIVVAYAFLFGFDYLVHHVWLMDLYEQTASLWRSPETMADFMSVMVMRNIALIVVLGFIFTRNFEGKGITEGLRFGAMMGVLLAIMMASSYIWMPIPMDLAIGWAVSGLGTGIGLGIIFSLIYKKA